MASQSPLRGRSLVVVCGKGGVGKTTVAAGLALSLAAEGRSVVVAEVGARDDVARTLLGPEASGTYAPRSIGARIRHVSIDPEHAMTDYLRSHLPLRPLAALLQRTRLFAILSAATPGLAELLTIGKVWELARTGDDVVVLDAPATGHALALLEAPGTFAAAVDAGPLATQAREIDAFLRDGRRTAVVVVTTAEELAVNETVSLRDQLRARLGLGVEEVVVNGVYPQRFSAADLRTLDAAPPSPACRAARFSAIRARRHRAQIRRLRTALAGDVPVRVLPFVFSGTAVPAALLAELGELAA